MRATLLHNPVAGSDRLADSETLVGAIEDLGWAVRLVDPHDLESAVAEHGDLLVVAGGDGTVGRVAKRIAGTGIPMAIIPTGTANNVARTLGIGVDARSAIDGLARPSMREVDLGVVRNGADERFLEGFSLGAIAYVIAERATKEHKDLRRAARLFADELEKYAPHAVRLEVDGKDLSGQYVIACAMNLRRLGPALGLAPEAELDDGAFDVVLVRPENKHTLVADLRRVALDGNGALSSLEIHRAEHARIAASGIWSTVDDSPRKLEGDVELTVEPRAVRFVLPMAAPYV